VRLVFRLVNVAIALVTLASALAVLGSDLLIPGYREHYRDAEWFVVLYAAAQVVMIVQFARDRPLVPWLALGKALAAYAFLATFVVVWPIWRMWTPARYVYQLFDWQGSRVGLFAFVFLGRGAFNTVNAFYFTEPWWRRLRTQRPFLGRVVTALAPAILVLCIWSFVELVREEARTFSPDAQEVAQAVYGGLDCDAVRANVGKTTTDIRKRGESHFEVRIVYGCTLTRVVVRAEDGRMGGAAGPRLDCCPEPSCTWRPKPERQRVA
jgi:hypothetical protein